MKNQKSYSVLVDLGENSLRSIVSGAAEFYSPEEMTGRQVLVIANLAKQWDISEGMILFSDDNGKLVLIEAPEQVNPRLSYVEAN